MRLIDADKLIEDLQWLKEHFYGTDKTIEWHNYLCDFAIWCLNYEAEKHEVKCDDCRWIDANEKDG